MKKGDHEATDEYDSKSKEGIGSYAPEESTKYVLKVKSDETIIVDIHLFSIAIDQGSVTIGIIKDRTKQYRLDEAIRKINHGIVANSGESFFQKLVLTLSDTLDADIAYLAKIDKNSPDRVSTQAVAIDHQIVENFSFVLDDTPCKQVLEEGITYYPNGICKWFPKNKILADIGFDGYFGFPLFGTGHCPIGVLVIADRKPMPDVSFIETVIEILASRAAAELERADAEQALRKSQEAFRDMALSTSDWLWEVDANGVYVYCSDKVVDVLGYAPEEIIGKTPFNLMPPDEAEKIGCEFWEIFEQKSPIRDLINWNIHKKGHRVCVLTNGVPILDEDGILSGYRGTDKDITSIVDTTKALQNSEATLRATLESTGDGVLVVDKQGKFIEANARYAEMWNIPQHVIDSGDHETALQIALGQVADPDSSFEKIKEIRQSSDEQFITVNLKDGRVYELFTSPLILDGENVGRVWNYKDVTERIKVEVELRRNKLMIDKANIAILWIHRDGTLTDVNEAVCKMLGYSRRELLGMSVFDFDKKFDKDLWEESWKSTKTTAQSQILSEHTRMDGRIIPVEIISNHIEFNNEEYQCCFVTDISARKRNETVQSVLYEISEATGRVNSLVDLLEVIQKQLGRLIDTDNFYVALYDEATGLYSFPFVCDASSIHPGEISPQELSRTLTDYVRRHGESILLTERDQIDLIKSGEVDLFGDLSKIWMGIPLILSGRAIGVVGIQSYTNEAQYTHQDKDLMSIVASSIAMAIERKRNERDLAAANQMMRNVLDTIPVRVFWKDTKSIYLGCNELFALDAGFENVEEVIGKTDAEFKWNDRAEAYFKSDQDIINHGIPKLDYVEPIVLPDKSFGWAHSSKIPLRDTSDRIVGVLGVYQDITDRIRAEEAVRHERDLAQRYLNIAGVVLLALDTEGVITMINPKGCSILCYDHQDLIGKNWFDKCVPFNSRETTKAEFKRLINGEKGEVCRFENPILTADGKRRLISWIDTLVRDDEGQVVGTLSSGEDITDRKHNERILKEKEANLAEAQRIAKVGSWEYNIEEDRIEVSDEIYRIFGLNPENKITRSGVFSLLTHPDDKQRVVESNRATNEDGEPTDIKYRIVRPDGEIRHVHEQAQVKLDQNGRPILVFGTVQDISELVKAEEERKALESQLRRTQRLETIGTLAGGIAHDFNNILTPILGYADMALISVPEDHDVREDLEHVIRAAHRAKELVKQILTFSRQGDQEKKPLEIYLIVKEVLELMRASLPSTISISQNIHKDCGSVLADPSQIHQVIMNLCTNAFHAMRANGGTLSVSLTLDAEYAKARPGPNDQSYIRVSISDTGHGMNKETMERIFEPFFTTKGVGEGTGLGLSVVHGIITNHGGDITVESEPGKGTTFHIYLPQVQQRISETDYPSCHLAGGNEHILVVDDEEEITTMAKRMLDKFGYRVTTRNSSVDALKLFSASPREFDLVVLDQTMPYLTGSELASELMAIRPDIPVIIITGYSETITAKDARRLGIREYLTKPLVASDLNTAIRKQLGKLKKTEV